MKIGFARRDITPPLGLELGGYAGYRPCSDVHDPLYCKVILLEQENRRYALVMLDLMCADESLWQKIACAISDLGICRQNLIVAAIHSHAAPAGVVPKEGPLAQVNDPIVPQNPVFTEYMQTVVRMAADACRQASEELEHFRVRTARRPMPPIGSERHSGEPAHGDLTVVQFRTESGKNVILYNIPCHPTVLSAANLSVSADFAGCVEDLLDADMAVFVNGAAGDISTRFTRRGSTFEECGRLGGMVAQQIRQMLEDTNFVDPEPLRGIHTTVRLQARQVSTVEAAQEQLEQTTARWQQAVSSGADAATVRILKSYVEGAGVNLEFAATMVGMTEFEVPVTVFRFAGVPFVSIPGEFYSTLLPPQTAAICYANGYYRYIADTNAYDTGHYEALAAIVARGGGEQLGNTIRQLLDRLK